ncbi:MAG TPA: transposase [Thermoanaerobaculia bacterium]
MSRPLRLEFPGALYHVTSRGHERGPIFRDSADRRHFLNLLASVIPDQAWLLHSYCLMGNHYHLLLETGRPTLSRGMHALNARYSQHFNRRHDRAGHVFEGRFKAIVVQKQPHLLELHRYIVLNPVRAGLVRRPQDWPWSNYRATSGAIVPPAWLEVGSTLSLFAAFGSGANGAYVRFVADGAVRPGSPLEHVRRQIYLGDRRFLEEMADHAEHRRPNPEIPATHRMPSVFEIDEILKLVSKEWGLSADELAGREAGDAKLAAIYLSRRLCGKSAREVGDAFGIKRGRVGNIMAEMQKRRRTYLRKRVENLVADFDARLDASRNAT